MLLCILFATLLFLSGCAFNEGMTPLMFAAKSGNIQKLSELIEKGADVDDASQYGWTALMFACWKGHEQVVEKLLDAGADPNIVSEYVPSGFETVGGYPSSTALAEAVRKNHTSIANLLINRGALIDPLSLAHAGGQGNISLLEKFLEEGANLNQPSNNVFNPSPLCSASGQGKIDAVKWLINNGANPNLITNGRTPLSYAIWRNRTEVVSYLLDNGANPNIVYGEHWGPTALFEAVGSCDWNRDDKIIKMLLDHGADKSYRTEKYGTALEYIKLQRSNTVKYIEEQKKITPIGQERLRKSLGLKDKVIELLEQ
jgi:uncharacterized protein